MASSEDNFLKVATKTVTVAGQVARKYFGHDLSKTFKNDNSFATKADLEAEQAMREVIKANFPDHDILGEELGSHSGRSDYQWVFDPIDGTRNFSFGVPRFTCASALLHRGKLACAAILNPTNQELFTAQVNRGAWLNGQKLKIEDSPPLSIAIIAFGRGRADRPEFHKLFANLEPRVGSPRIMGSSLLMMTEVARSRFAGMLSTIDNIWDMAAGVLLVREAGGVAKNFKSEDWTSKDQEVVLGSNKIVKELLAEIKQ